MKINGDVSGVAFSPDGSKVFANSGKSRKGGRVCSCSCHVINLCVCVCVRAEDGEVYVWDMRSSRCVNRFTDDGCVRGTSIATSQNGQYLACG